MIEFNEQVLGLLSHRIAMTLLHFLWQATWLAVLLALILKSLPGATAQFRYGLAVAVLCAMVAVAPVTFVLLGTGTSMAVDSTTPGPVPSDVTRPFATEIPAEPSPTILQTANPDSSKPPETSEPTNQLAAAKPMSIGLRAFPAQTTLLAKWVTATYLLGVLLMLLRLCTAIHRASRIRRLSKDVDDLALLGLLNAARGRIGIHWQPAIKLSQEVAAPVVLGIIKPTILLPSSLATGLTPDQLQSILMHELAHIRRHDLLVSMLQRLAESAFFFHPALWYVSRQINNQRENCCDDLVTGAGVEPAGYAETLVLAAQQMACRASADRHALVSASATGSDRSQLRTRVLRLLSDQPTGETYLRGQSWWTAIALVASVILVVLPATLPTPPSVVPAALAAQQPGAPVPRREASSSPGTSRMRLHELARLLERDKLDEVYAQFHDSLRAKLNRQEFDRAWRRAQSAGPLRDVDYERALWIGGREFHVYQLKHRSGDTFALIDLDSAGWIAGFGFGFELNQEDSQPKIAFGERLASALQLFGRIQCELTDPDGGHPTNSLVRLYKLADSQDAVSDDDWIDDRGQRWKYIASAYGAPEKLHFTRLAVGEYRVLGCDGSPASARIGVSRIVKVLQETPESDAVDAAIQLQQGQRVKIRPMARDKASSVEDARVTLECIDARYPPMVRKRNRDAEGFVFENVPAGLFQINAYQRAPRWDGLRFENDPEANKVAVIEGRENQFAVEMTSRKLTDEEIISRVPWVARGKVTDRSGNPIPDVELWAAAGYGSLRSVKIATTDANGEYTGRFGSSGMMFMDTDPDANYMVGAFVWARKKGVTEVNLNRGGSFHAASRRPREEEKTPTGFDANKLFLPGQPQEINFVMAASTTVAIKLLDAEGTPLTETHVSVQGKQLPPASSAAGTGQTDGRGVCVLEDVPRGFAWSFAAGLSKRKWASSPSLRLREDRYGLVLQEVTEEQTGRKLLRLVSATVGSLETDLQPGVGLDQVEKAQGAEARRPVLPEKEQERGRAILVKIAQANAAWLGGLPDGVGSFSYRFHLAENDPLSITASDRSLALRRGISYFGAIDHLTGSPENVVFRRIHESGNKLTLEYSLKQPVKIHAGNGLSGSWRGYFSRPLEDGVMVLDSRRLVPLSHQSGPLRETYSEYQATGAGKLVPLRIQISKMNFDWRFKIHDNRLWLFERSARLNTDSLEEDIPLVRITDVKIAEPVES